MGEHHSTYVPNTGIERWIDARLPIVRLMHDSAVSYPVPRNLNYFWTFGAILMVMLVSQIITGIVLVMHYTPHVDHAFQSVEHIMRDVNYGWLMRYMHANGASMFFIAVYCHIFRGMYYGSYKAPRELLWILGVVIFLLMMATAFMGYVLPWGQMSFWGATVITNLFSAIPVVGESIVTWLWGGYAVDNPTLNRFFSLHYLLPFMIFGVVILHVWALHHVGQNNPDGVDVKNYAKDTVPFTPYATVKDLFAIVLFLMFFSWFVFFHPNFLGHADNYIPADPLKTPAHIVPEWYFLPFYGILRAIPDKLGGVVAMFASIAILAFLPWLDTSKVRSGNYRPIFKIAFWVFVVVCFLLGYTGSQPTDKPVLQLGGRVVMDMVGFAQLLTALYFAYFLLALPLLGLFEKPKPLPASIADAVLARKGGSHGHGGHGTPAGAHASPEK
jgi:ubiquinol-cytochrome c reductase cytochrome b/c1 subunit